MNFLVTLKFKPDFDEAALLQTKLAEAPAGGLTIDGVGKALDAIKLVQDGLPAGWAANQTATLVIKSEDYGYIQARLREARWPAAHEMIRDFCNRVLNAPSEAPPAPEPSA